MDPTACDFKGGKKARRRPPSWKRKTQGRVAATAKSRLIQTICFCSFSYNMDQEFTKKKDKEKVREEASSSNHGLEDVLKGLEDRLMTCLSEVNVKVETMDKRLGVIEKSQERIKGLEKKLEKIEDCQYYLKKKAKKVETMDERIDGIEKEMKKLKETEKENNEGFDYQGMDFDWDMTYGTERKKPVDTEMVEDTEVVEEPEGQRAEETDKEEENKEAENEKESEEEAQKEDEGSEEEKEHEPEAKAEEDKEPEEEKEQGVEAEDAEEKVGTEAETQAEDAEEEVGTEAQVEAELEIEAPAEAGEDVGKEGEEDVPEKEEHKKYTEEEKQGWILSIYKSNDGIPDVDKMDGTERSHAHSSVKHMPKDDM
ncbi:hypothetical protein Bca4012_076557 [Brassica carinata]